MLNRLHSAPNHHALTRPTSLQSQRNTFMASWLFLCVLFSISLISSTAMANNSASKDSVHSEITQPPFSIDLSTLNGKITTLANIHQNKPSYVKLWATWCQPCMQQLPHFEQTHRQYKKALNVVGINVWVNESMEAIDEIIEKHTLSHQIVIDKSGSFANSVDLLGTPLHLLFDAQGRLVHKGHTASETLDDKIALLATGTNRLASTDGITTNKPSPPSLALGLLQGTSAVLFTSTFCDWYLKDSRPAMAENCIVAQKFANQHFANLTSTQTIGQPIQWKTVVSRLWTGEAELNDYRDKYAIDMPSEIDTNNWYFTHHKITLFPTLVIFNNGVEVGRTTDFNNSNNLNTLLKSM